MCTQRRAAVRRAVVAKSTLRGGKSELEVSITASHGPCWARPWRSVRSVRSPWTASTPSVSRPERPRLKVVTDQPLARPPSAMCFPRNQVPPITRILMTAILPSPFPPWKGQRHRVALPEQATKTARAYKAQMPMTMLAIAVGTVPCPYGEQVTPSRLLALRKGPSPRRRRGLHRARRDRERVRNTPADAGVFHVVNLPYAKLVGPVRLPAQPADVNSPSSSSPSRRRASTGTAQTVGPPSCRTTSRHHSAAHAHAHAHAQGDPEPAPAARPWSARTG